MKPMDRRSFIKSIGAAGLLPALPIPSFAVAPVAASPAVSAHTYQWAELIVRAHNKFSPGMLQRSLRIDSAAASVLKEQLIKNGVLSAQANAYGIHAATKPLYEGAFISVSETAEKLGQVTNKASEVLDEITDPDQATIEAKPSDQDDIPETLQGDQVNEDHASEALRQQGSTT